MYTTHTHTQVYAYGVYEYHSGIFVFCFKASLPASTHSSYSHLSIPHRLPQDCWGVRHDADLKAYTDLGLSPALPTKPKEPRCLTVSGEALADQQE